MYEKAVYLIQQYIDECLFEPRSNWPNNEFSKRTYSRWAAYEILDRIMSEADRLPPHITGREQREPIDIIEEFVHDLDIYSGVSYYGRFQNIFIIARDTAIDILLLLKTKGDVLNDKTQFSTDR